MKETEKERCYNEALERARKIHNQTEFDYEKGLIEEIFPELRESEDEKMMNQLHSWMKEFGGAEEYTEKVYQWIKRLLEKHKYTEEDLDKAYKCADEVQYRRGYEDAKKDLERQGEVPVTINIDKMVEDYANDKECNNEGFGKPVNCMIRAYRQGITDTLVILNLRKQGEQKPIDKIEQEYHCTGVREPKEATGVLKQLLVGQKSNCSEEALQYLRENHSSSEMSDFQAAMNIAVANAYDKGKADAINTMKTEWSEEDERILNSIIEDVMPYGECPDYPTDEEREYFEEGNRKAEWLKSLKGRYTWKPSEKKM